MRFEDMFRAAVRSGDIPVPLDMTSEDFIAARVAQHLSADGRALHRKLADGRSVLVSERRSLRGGIVATGIDITEHLRLEEQLHQVQKMDAIGKLTGGLAHDLNNFLGIVLGNLDFLRDLTKDNADAAELVEAAVRGATRAVDLNRSLLAFARRQPLAPEIIDVAESVAETVKLLASALGETIDIAFVQSPELWPVLVDRGQLSSSLVNLANNARDAMPKGGKLTIALRKARRPGDATDYVGIEMTDTGSGMPPETVARAFEPFFTTKGAGHGTGLGLSMVYGFVKQSNGHVEIDSAAGSGTTIRIYLPRTQDGSENADYAVNDALPTGGERILVVEDNDGLRETVLMQLASLGYRTRFAGKAAEALAMLDRIDGACDLIFSDVVMPGGMDGFELVARAKARWPKLKVLLTSGYPGESRQPTLYRLLPKPCSASAIARQIEGYWDWRVSGSS